jgi:hypothetical protein
MKDVALQTARRAIRAVRLLAKDGRIPRPLRWLVLFGLLPLPGPADEGALLLAAGALTLFYRDAMRDAWWEAGEPASP